MQTDQADCVKEIQLDSVRVKGRPKKNKDHSHELVVGVPKKPVALLDSKTINEEAKPEILKLSLLRFLIKNHDHFKNIISKDYLIDEAYIKNVITSLATIPDCYTLNDLSLIKDYFENRAFCFLKNEVKKKEEALDRKTILFSCYGCYEELASDENKVVACSFCGTWFHISKKCSPGYDAKRDRRARNQLVWTCPTCLKFI